MLVHDRPVPNSTSLSVAPLFGKPGPTPVRERFLVCLSQAFGFLQCTSNRSINSRSSRDGDLFSALEAGLGEFGYIDQQTVNIEYRFVQQQYERFPELASELIRAGVAVIFTASDLAAAAAKKAAPTTPIVFAGTADPVKSGFAVSLSHPGRNMTGITQAGTHLTSKRLSLLKELKLSRIGVLWNPAAPTGIHNLPVAQNAARSLQVQAQLFEVRGPQDFQGAFAAMMKERIEAILLLPDSILFIAYEDLAQLALRHRLPIIGWRTEFARAGCLLAYGASVTADWHRAGVMIGRILRGASPADIPVEEPSTLELSVNLKTAKALGVTIPPSLMAWVDRVFE